MEEADKSNKSSGSKSDNDMPTLKALIHRSSRMERNLFVG